MLSQKSGKDLADNCNVLRFNSLWWTIANIKYCSPDLLLSNWNMLLIHLIKFVVKSNFCDQVLSNTEQNNTVHTSLFFVLLTFFFLNQIYYGLKTKFNTVSKSDFFVICINIFLFTLHFIQTHFQICFIN